MAVAALVAGVAAGAGACEGNEEREDARVFTAEDEAIEVEAGESFTVRLAENPTTGYEWAIVSPTPDPAVITVVEERYEADEGAAEAPGRGGTKYLVFRAEDAGTTDLRLVERREGDDRAAEELTFDVTVG